MVETICSVADPFAIHGAGACITQEIELCTTKDGQHISLGVEVYDENNEEYIITGLGLKCVWGRKGDSEIYKQLEPCRLTSRSHDTWEQLERDVAYAMFECCPHGNTSAKCKEYKTCDPCREDFAADLIHRAKALAEVE